MAYRDLRHYLAVLEAAGKLRRVARPVDPAWELAAVGILEPEQGRRHSHAVKVTNQAARRHAAPSCPGI